MRKVDFVVGSPFKEDAIEGSKSFPCCRCGTDTWLAPTGQEVLRQNDAEVVCYHCMREEDPEECNILPPTEEQLDAVEKILGERVDGEQVMRTIEGFLGRRSETHKFLDRHKEGR